LRPRGDDPPDLLDDLARRVLRGGERIVALGRAVHRLSGGLLDLLEQTLEPRCEERREVVVRSASGSMSCDRRIVSRSSAEIC
jgi:hypothetical protein